MRARSSMAPPIDGAAPLFSAQALGAADRRASTRHRIPSVLLMERAGLGAAQAILGRYPDRSSALAVCGSGNNGGDGYVVARHLRDAGWAVEIAQPRGHAPRTPDAMTMATIARTMGLRVRAFTPQLLGDPSLLVVDALLGTGSRGAPRGQVAAVIDAVNAAGHPVVAMDVPSGVDPDTGCVEGSAMHASLTTTFHGDKPGLHVEPGRTHAGEVEVIDIGIPSQVMSPAAGWLLGERISAGRARRAMTADKYASGAVLVVTGSPGLTGAGVLASRATLRAGAGLTVAAVPATVQPIYAGAIAEVMAAPIPDSAGFFTAESVQPVVDEAARVGALAIGPGLGRDPRTNPFVRAVIEAVDLPVVIDADGLWHLGRRPSWLRHHARGVILTPHTGEAARLLGRERHAVDARRLESARALADITGSVIVLKGPGAIVAGPDGACVIDGIGTSALATAGSGDVLTGIVAAMLAKGLQPMLAAAEAVALHSRAGVAAGRGSGTVAGDIIEALPEVLGG